DNSPEIGVNPETGDAYRQQLRQLHLLPPSPGAILGIWLGYLLALGLVLAVARRRVRALAALSLGVSLLALALGPLRRGVHPTAAWAGRLDLVSGEDEGWWWGHVALMMPGSGIISAQVPSGWMDTFWDAPAIRVPGSTHLIAQPFRRRWMASGTGLDTLGRLPGSVEFAAELEGNGLYARVRNRTSQPLTDLALV